MGGGNGSLFRVGDNVALARVLVFLSLLVVFIVALERLLHKLERSASRSHKHDEMLRKAYRELMILGFIGVGIKIYKEISTVDAYSASMIAFQVADLTIFILALALIVQAICVFLLLRRENYELDKAELTSTSDLADVVSQRWVGSSRQCKQRPMSDAVINDLVELRVLRHLFLRRYGLPELFPFSKYVRQVQDNQITHMIDVEMSMWLLLLGIAWGIDGAVVLVEALAHGKSEPHAIVVVFLIFSWSLVTLHIIVALYFGHCLKALLKAGGYTRRGDKIACLRVIAEDENAVLSEEIAGDALKAMQEVQERQERKRRADKQQYRSKHHHLIADDTGLQLLAMLVRYITARCCRRGRSESKYASRDGSVGIGRTTLGTSVDFSDAPTPSIAPPSTERPHRRNSAVLPVSIRWFSRKAWQFAVMFLMMLNGFYLALLSQCIVYQFGTLATHTPAMRVLLLVGLPLPVLLNMLLFQPKILRNFMIVSAILRVDVETLGEVVAHFSEIVELRTEFIHSLLMHLRAVGMTLDQLQCALQTKDRRREGIIAVEQLRQVLWSVGYRLSHFRFNSVARLLFRLRGTQVEYAQVHQMLSLALHEEEDASEIGIHQPPGHVLLRPSVLLEDHCIGLGVGQTSVDQEDGIQSRSPRARMLSSDSRMDDSTAPAASGLGHHRRPLMRHQSSLLTGSARALRSLYYLDGLPTFDVASALAHCQSDGITSSPRATVYVRM